MSASNYRPSLGLVLGHEGGYVNNPKDPGGPTNKGVTQKVYDAYRKLKGLPQQSVKLIGALEIEELYRTNYWRLVRGDSLPAGLDYAVFDFAVNSGVSRAIKYLQTTLKLNDVDGVIGDATLSASLEAARANEELLIATYCANRLAFMRSLTTFATFGKGWTRRVIGNIAGAQDSDTGVIDFAVKMAKNDDVFKMPTSIGDLPGEVAGKAFSDVDAYPVAAPQDIAALMQANDSLAVKIALSKIN